MKVLVVEDESKMAAFLERGFREQHFEVELCDRGDSALQRIQASAFDAVVLDIMLPGLDGITVVRRLREQGNATPVLILSARGHVDERVEGLEAGADDYLAKPFAIKEVVARARALSRRMPETRAQVLKLADLTLDLVQHEARRNGVRLDLSTREFKMLEVLLRNAGRICGRTLLLEQVWDFNFDPGTNLVDVYVKRLRRKLDDGHEVKLVHTVRGSGYVLKEGEA
ncbi:response regulator transcription factor [Roseimicrobium sp. ORNL1]|uniref:response regulator n=1 Tax=Roseimicrobium sp. ORNL1 TaxID=2711231 RepID=UPI0013E1EF43|nr:response regulator transcription factor [Roseimicrobium sp. ORNL1]QIE99979.1 response regulator transcription factor [Roseimicrobium sp. ORNL1]